MNAWRCESFLCGEWTSHCVGQGVIAWGHYIALRDALVSGAVRLVRPDGVVERITGAPRPKGQRYVSC